MSGVLVVAREGQPHHCQPIAAADPAPGTEPSCDTVYDVGSVTKSFTGAAVAKLVSEGELALDDPISDYLPNVPADKQRITVEQLATHTAGFPGALGDDYEPVGRDELVELALSTPLRSEPGAEHSYSNVGYSLLAAIIEEASGLTYEEYLAEELLGPAGASSTGYVLPDWGDAQVATEYDARDNARGTPLDQPWAEDGPFWNLRGNGGLLSTPSDMAAWATALMGDEVLDAEAKDELFEPRVRETPGGASRYGLGWVVSPTPLGRLEWHDGSNDRSFSIIARFPELETTVFAVSSDAYPAEGPGLPERAEALVSGVAKRAEGRG